MSDPAAPPTRRPEPSTQAPAPAVADVEATANDTVRPYPDGASIPELFRRVAEDTPHATAVLFDGGELSYGELAERVDALARRLAARGVGAESAVGLAMERSPEMLVALLAILRAGGFYVPLDPGYPRERLAFMERDAGCRWVLADRASADAQPCDGSELVLFADLTAEPDPGDVELPTPAPEQLAYAMYTSGSTGTPKGVAVTHRNVIRLVRGSELIRFGEDQTFLQFAPVSFDASTLEIFGPLLNGGRLALFPGTRATPQEVTAAVERFGVTTLWLTAGLFHQVVEADLAGLAPVQQLLAGGDVLSPAHVRRVLDELPGTTMINGYGPTENTTFTTTHRASRDDGDGPVPIGRPIANTRVHLLDESFSPVAAGEEGELLAGGDGVARGYLGRPALTAASFVPDPFGEPGSRLYRTGDRARWRADGALDFRGRIDHQVKIRGFRIEPGESEAVLAGAPGVASAAVVVREPREGEKRLVGYAVAAEGEQLDASALRAHLAERLPEYLVPARFVLLDAMPLNPNGKIDRRALPAPGADRPELDVGYRAPEGDTEEWLARLWGELLGLERVGADDPFIELGGHSLLATRMAARVRDELGVDVALADVFAHPTVAKLARRVEELRAGGAADTARPPLTPTDRETPAPLSYPQQQVWFHQTLRPDSLAYNTQFTVRLRGDLDVATLERALTEVVRRHEALHTTFHDEGGEAVQRVREPWKVELEVDDVSGGDPAQVEEELRRVVAEAVRVPFVVSELPLVRWRLVRTAPREHHLVHVEHHLIHDGWSVGVFLGEVVALYEAFASGAPSPLSPLPVQYSDFAAWQRGYLRGDLLEAKLDEVEELLAGFPTVLDLTTDLPRPREQTFRGARLDRQLPADLYADVRAFSRRHGVTLFTTMLAVFEALMARLSGTERFLVGSGAGNRHPREVEALIGMVVNTVVLPADLTGDPTFEELLERIRGPVITAWQHQDLPVEQLVDRIGPQRDLSRNPLFQVMFSFHDSPIPDLRFAGLEGELEIQQNASSKADLNVICIPRAEQRVGREASAEDRELEMLWEYSTDLFHRSTVERLWRTYRSLLRQVVERPERRLSELSILSPAERARVVHAFNDTAAPLGSDRPVPGRVLATLDERPQAPAVVDAAGEVTPYGELGDRARRLAAELARRGVGRGSRVAVCAERSTPSVAALLAVLETGAAYVPIDPHHPVERAAWTVRDAEVAAVLVDEANSDRLAGALGGDAPPLLSLDDAELPAAGDFRPVEVGADELAYMIYTSGSTGRPKGVAVTHHSLMNLVEWYIDANGLGADDRTAHLSGQAFDASILDLWPTLVAGGELHLPPEEIRMDPEGLRDWLLERRITVTFVATPLAERMLALEWPADAPLRLLLTGGDALHGYPRPELPFRLLNFYGPTENTVLATAGTVPPRDPSDDAAQAPPHIGSPIRNVRTYVVDARMEPVPEGVPGELLAAGESLARGYWNRPALTAEHFVPDPFASEPGSRLYRTGDRVRWLASGDLEFLGRVDFQVQVRGFRIEPGEIEVVMTSAPGVGNSVVLAVDSGGEVVEKRLVGYWEPSGDGPGPDEASLRAHLEERLPDYMVPGALVRLDELPLNASGKVDRGALPAPDLAPEAHEFVAPRDEMEELVADVWGEVLGVERVGVHDGFFALGGHSLAATRVTSRLRDLLEMELSLSALFDNPVLADYCRAVEARLLAEEEMAGA